MKDKNKGAKKKNEGTKKEIAKITKKGMDLGKTTNKQKKLDSFIWLVIIVLVIAGIVANSYYNQVAGALRAAGGIVLAALILGLAATTAQGKKAWTFIKGSRAELRKVVWPTRQETVQTTLIVVAMVLVTALILWGLDTLFLWAIGWLTGQRG